MIFSAYKKRLTGVRTEIKIKTIFGNNRKTEIDYSLYLEVENRIFGRKKIKLRLLLRLMIFFRIQPTARK